ncbi:hypothetical protein [Brevibacillus sp. MCWH]|uniref:hypothetical protein n=1 Tax=Brevibacillus sp. MCWH TaxID=2508871 RepID=UPI001C0EB43B|nr:hypothetical protein [Brevibacillus sp. MCWH]
MDLRNLTVGITLEDNATSGLIWIDDKTDDIRDNFQGMKNDLAGLSVGFGQVGIAGSRAMDGTEDAVDDLKDEIRNLADQIALLALASEAAFEKMEDDVDDVEDEMEHLGHETNRTTAKVVLLGTALTAAFSGGVAASAPLLAGIGALVAAFGAAGIGAAAFGAVAVGALTNIFETQEEIAKLQEKIEKADSAKERIKAQKELAAIYADMSQEQQNALKALQSFKTFWGGFVKQFEKPIFQTFANSLKGLQGVLTGLQPTIQNVADVFVELTDEFNESLDSPAMQRFFTWLETNAAESLYNFAHIFGNTFLGITNMFSAFAPLGASVEEWLVRITQRFEEWSAGLSQSTGFQKFVEYAKENGPILADTLSNIWDIGVGLVKALAPLGSEVLKGLQSMTEYISVNVIPVIDSIAEKAAGFASTIRDNWGPIKETVIGLGTAFLTFKGIMLGMTIIGTINQLITAFRTGTLMATIAQWGLNAAMLANPMTWVAAGIATLVAIGVLLYRNWDTIKAKAGELWASMREKWAGIKQSTSETWNNVKTSISNAMTSAKTKVSNFFSPLLEFIRSAKAKWDSFVGALKNFKMPKIGLPKWMGGKGLIQLPGHATGLSRVPYDNYVARLHKDETVLRADQSRALEQAGILDRSGHTPRINPLGTAPSSSPKVAGGSVVFSPKVDIHVTAADVKSAGSLEAAVNRKLEEMWQMFMDIYATEVVC